MPLVPASTTVTTLWPLWVWLTSVQGVRGPVEPQARQSSGPYSVPPSLPGSTTRKVPQSPVVLEGSYSSKLLSPVWATWQFVWLVM